MNIYKFKPQLGQKVAVCYDGKWSRSQKGTIIKVNRSTFVVSFIPWANNECGEVTIKVRWRKNIQIHFGWLKGWGTHGIMRKNCDYYSVLPISTLEQYGYTVGDSSLSASAASVVRELSEVLKLE